MRRTLSHCPARRGRASKFVFSHSFGMPIARHCWNLRGAVTHRRPSFSGILLDTRRDRTEYPAMAVREVPLWSSAGLIRDMSQRESSMGWFKRDKERDRFYLLPGMGGRAARAKHKRILQWSIAIGLIVSAIMAAAIYFANRPGIN